MSRIGQAPIAVPAGVEVAISGDSVTVKGKLGELSQEVSSGITVKIEDSTITLSVHLMQKSTKPSMVYIVRSLTI